MDVKEGFLCPMCFEDLKSFHNLQSHFETSHSMEDKAVMSQIKGLFSKAKDKLLKKEFEGSENATRNPFAASPSAVGHSLRQDSSFWDPQELGITRSHIDVFKAIRDARIDRVVIETNKIVIRLEKLLKPVAVTRKANRKAFEQSLVPWVQDEDVPFCPTCGDKFAVARRRHHCRLCGAIMCTKCSIFLPFQIAEDLVKSVQSDTNLSLVKRNSKIQRHSQLAEEESEKILVRICFECDKVLQRNKEKLDRRHNPTLLVLLYGKMQKAMNDAVKYGPEFVKMAESLNSGEEEFKLDVANDKRFQLMQMFEAIDVISKKIVALNAEDDEHPPSKSALRLQTAIRRAAYSFLQDNMLSLPSLPSQPKLQVLQAQRRAESERRLRQQRIEAQRQREEEKRRQDLEKLRQERNHCRVEQNAESSILCSSSNAHGRPSILMVKDPGWSVDTISITSNTSRHSNLRSCPSDDADGRGVPNTCLPSKEDPLEPLLEQIQYVTESAKQAHAAGMEAEAESLEKNLEELKKEYRKQKTARAFAITPTTPTNSELRQISQINPTLESFKPSMNTNDTGEDPLLQQIRYISKCIEEATVAKKHDEARILTENLEELRETLRLAMDSG